MAAGIAAIARERYIEAMMLEKFSAGKEASMHRWHIISNAMTSAAARRALYCCALEPSIGKFLNDSGRRAMR